MEFIKLRVEAVSGDKGRMNTKATKRECMETKKVCCGEREISKWECLFVALIEANLLKDICTAEQLVHAQRR